MPNASDALTVSTVELQYIDRAANHDKFYRTFLIDSVLVTQYGRNETFGTFGRKEYANAAAAEKAAAKTVAAKLAKGYERSREGILSFAGAPGDSDLDAAASRLAVGDVSTAMPSRPVSAVVTAVNEGTVTDPKTLGRVTDALGLRYSTTTVAERSGPTRPMLAESVGPDGLASLLSDDAWAAQPKLDGERVVIEVVDGVVSALNRAGQPKVKNVNGEGHLAPFRHLSQGRWVFDGEVVGRTLWLFDMPAAGAFYDESAPFEVRLDALCLVAAQLDLDPATVGLVTTTQGKSAKSELLAGARKAGKEGVIFRSLAGLYEPGRRSRGLLKHKFLHDADCVVMALDPVKDSITLGVFDATGQLLEVGAASTIGKGTFAVGDVASIRFLYVVDALHPRMFQPRIMAKRDDKPAAGCSIEQFAGAVTDKSV